MIDCTCPGTKRAQKGFSENVIFSSKLYKKKNVLFPTRVWREGGGVVVDTLAYPSDILAAIDKYKIHVLFLPMGNKIR